MAYERDHAEFVMVRIRREVYADLLAWIKVTERHLYRERVLPDPVLNRTGRISASLAVAALLRRDNAHRLRSRVKRQRKRKE